MSAPAMAGMALACDELLRALECLDADAIHVATARLDAARATLAGQGAWHATPALEAAVLGAMTGLDRARARVNILTDHARGRVDALTLAGVSPASRWG